MAVDQESQKTQHSDEMKFDKPPSESMNGDEEKSAPHDHEDHGEVAPAKPDDKEAATPASGDAGPPDGGSVAWMQVLGGWMLFFNTWGILNTFGVYQTFYESGQLWSASSSTIAWIGSIQAFMVLIVGTVSGPIFDRGYLRTLLIVGSFLVVFGHMMLSLTHNFWQALLAQGFTIGIGAGCLFIPGVALLPMYFTKRLGLAIGLAASGSSMGGIIYPIMFFKLVDQVGFAWATRIIGFTALATLLIPISISKIRVQPKQVRSVIDWSAFTDLQFMLFVFGAMIGFIGLYVGFFYTSFYGQATGLTDASLSFYLVPILNAGSVLGRTMPNWLSDQIGPLNVIAPGSILVGVVLLCYIAVFNTAGMIVSALLFGFFSGIFIALPPVLFVALTKDKTKVGTRMGMGFAICGLGVLAGGPGGGGILGNNSKDLHWNATWTYGGVVVLGAGAVFTILRIMRGGMSLRVKV